MWRAHVAGMPADEHDILAGSVDIGEHVGGFRHSGREVVKRIPGNLVRPRDDGHDRIDAGGADRPRAKRHRGHREHGRGDEIAPARFKNFDRLGSSIAFLVVRRVGL
jgi:hypothetical protein